MSELVSAFIRVVESVAHVRQDVQARTLKARVNLVPAASVHGHGRNPEDIELVRVEIELPSSAWEQRVGAHGVRGPPVLVRQGGEEAKSIAVWQPRLARAPPQVM